MRNNDIRSIRKQRKAGSQLDLVAGRTLCLITIQHLSSRYLNQDFIATITLRRRFDRQWDLS